MALIAAVWVVSDVGFHFLLPRIGLIPSYIDDPSVAAGYYAAWIPVTFVIFRAQYRGWTPFGPARPLLVFVPLFAAFALAFAIYAPAALPDAIWNETGKPPDILVASTWYFLPKSVDILLQQLLIAGLVLAFSAGRRSLWEISGYCAILFGSSHLLLAFGSLPAMYVIRFTVFASLFGLLFPYLILRVPNGIVYSYATHWTYYAATLVTAHTISPYAS